MLHRAVRNRPPIATHANGLRIYLEDGTTILDASGGAAVSCLGHGSRRVAEKMGSQAAQLGYVHTSFFSNEPAEELAELLIGDEPGGLARAFFVSSGSEAMEAALKLARQYFLELGQPQRTQFISRRQSYHGNTLGALALSGHAARRSPYEPLLASNVTHVSPCFPFHYQAVGETDSGYVARLAAELEAAFQRIGPDRVIAFCAETIVGATAGCVTASPLYFEAIREVCSRHGSLLILDEVMSGMGRTGTTHAWQQEGIAPDIQAVAKGLGAGYAPIGGILISKRVVEALEAGSGAFAHGHTYQAHPVACAGALEVQRIIRDENLMANVSAMGKCLSSALRERFCEHPYIADIRGRGLFWGLEFSPDPAARTAFAPELKIAEKIKRCALNAGVAIYPGSGTIDGTNGDHLIIAPPYTITPDDVGEIVARLSTAVDRLFA